jgi:hypothetical protein
MNIEGYEQVLITDYDLSNSEKDERMDDMYSVLAKKRINNRILAKTGKVSLELLNDRKIIDRETFIELISEW